MKQGIKCGRACIRAYLKPQALLLHLVGTAFTDSSNKISDAEYVTALSLNAQGDLLVSGHSWNHVYRLQRESTNIWRPLALFLW